MKNATRLHYIQCEDFETLRTKVQEEEYEMFKSSSKKESDSSERTNVKSDIQHQPLNLAGNREKDIKDISRRLENIEKMLRFNRWFTGNKNKGLDKNQNSDQKPNEPKNQNQTQNCQNKGGDNQQKAKQEETKAKTDQNNKKGNLNR